MKTLKSITWVAFIGIMLMATQSFAQRGNRTNRANNCCQNIPGLTEEQNQQIQELRTAHLNEMAELRQERRSTADWDQKDEVRDQMLQKQEEHKNEVRALLNDDQKAYFDANYQKWGNRDGNRKGNRGKGAGGKGNRGGKMGGGNRTR